MPPTDRETLRIPASEEQLRRLIADCLGLAPAEVGDEDLIEQGLDSITLMTLVGRWQRAGLGVTVAEFAEMPTISAWWARIHRASPRPVARKAADDP